MYYEYHVCTQSMGLLVLQNVSNNYKYWIFLLFIYFWNWCHSTCRYFDNNCACYNDTYTYHITTKVYAFNGSSK